ncbi:MAG: hypothetical protein ACKOAU_12720, partial [Pirellula sp.]
AVVTHEGITLLVLDVEDIPVSATLYRAFGTRLVPARIILVHQDLQVQPAKLDRMVFSPATLLANSTR